MMYIAIDDNGNRVHISNAIKEQNYKCPLCKDKVIIKDGSIRIKHYAHAKLQCQDDFSNDMSEWHYEWQEQFPEEAREIVVKAKTHDTSDMEYHGEDFNYLCMDMPSDTLLQHRADIIIGNTVIEFQHSPISEKDFLRRNYFYGTLLGLDVVWVFDASNADIEYIRDSNNGELFSWKRAFSTLKHFIPQNDPNITIYLDFDGEEVRKVKWCIYKEDDTADYKRTILETALTREEFVKRYNK